MPRRLLHPGQGPDVRAGARGLAREGERQDADRLRLPHRRHRPRRGRHARGARHAAGAGRHLVQALHGVQGRPSGRRRDALPRDAGRGGERRARDGARRERGRDRRPRPRGAVPWLHRADPPCAHAAARARGRGDQPRHPARADRRQPALRRPRDLPRGGRPDPPRARAGLGRLGRDVHAVLLPVDRRPRTAGLRGREVRLLAAGARRGEPRRALGRGAHRRALRDLDRPLRLPLGRAEDARQGRLHEDPERRPRARGPAEDDPPLRRPRGPDQPQPDGRPARDAAGEAVRPLSAQGDGRRRLRRRSRRLRPRAAGDDLGVDAPLEVRLQPLRGHRGRRRARDRAPARQRPRRGRRARRHARAWAASCGGRSSASRSRPAPPMPS